MSHNIRLSVTADDRTRHNLITESIVVEIPCILGSDSLADFTDHELMDELFQRARKWLTNG